MKIKKALVGAAFAAVLTVAAPAAALAGNGPADGRCVAQGAGFTFDGPTKASVARGELGIPMRVVILDHVFNNANAVEAALGITICD
jgi:hypothetical protein